MSITVKQFYEYGKESLALDVVAGEAYLDNEVEEEALNRPGLALTGFFQFFAFRRIQVVGLAENAYLKSLSDRDRAKRIQDLFSRKIPCMVLTRSRHPLPEMWEAAEEYKVPLLKSPMLTNRFINSATIVVENLMAPVARFQGTMMEIMGVGVLIEGKPGIGKSETALALIERGHSLVSDDITVLRKNNMGEVIGSAADLTRYHMEIRGLGIIHIPSLFGVASMRKEARLDLVIRLRRPEPDLEYDRTGLSPEFTSIFGVKLPVITIPVTAGRDLAHVVEVAALNQTLKKLGHDAAKELDEKLLHVLGKKGKS